MIGVEIGKLQRPDWSAVVKDELSAYVKEKKDTIHRERDVARQVEEGLKSHKKWMDGFQSIADLKPPKLFLLRDKLPISAKGSC